VTEEEASNFQRPASNAKVEKPFFEFDIGRSALDVRRFFCFFSA